MQPLQNVEMLNADEGQNEEHKIFLGVDSCWHEKDRAEGRNYTSA